MIQPFLCPVMRRAPGRDVDFPGPVHVEHQRLAAREACRGSAEHLGLRLGEFQQDARGLPLPVDGWHWSAGLARQVVCGVVYPAPIGIAVAPVERPGQAPSPEVARREEFELLGGFSWRNFSRILTAKESVLKKAGDSVHGISACQIIAAPTPRSMVLHHGNRYHFVHQSHHRDHLVSMSADVADDAEIRWQWWPQGTPLSTD